MFVMATQLNGRANPRKTAFVEARFDQGDTIKATGEWSKDHHWIEVEGGETGTVWVYADYVSERKRIFTMKNVNYKTVRIRSRPIDGRVNGYVRKGKCVEITRVVLGWGKCKNGWVDLSLLEEVTE